MKNEKVDYTGVYIVKIDKLEKKVERLNKIIDELVDVIGSSLKVDIIEKTFNMEFDDFIKWLKEELKGSDKE